MPKFIIASVRTVRTMEFREVEARDANAASTMSGKLIAESELHNSKTVCNSTIESDRFSVDWIELTKRLRGGGF